MSDTTGSPPRELPDDVVTGFWLWAIALPLMLTGYVLAAVTAPGPTPAWLVNASSAVFGVTVAAAVSTFLVLMRLGYRWARTLLTGGGVASVVYAALNLLEFDGSPVVATAVAATTIVGSVLIAGGVYLLHRKAAHAFFTR